MVFGPVGLTLFLFLVVPNWTIVRDLGTGELFERFSAEQAVEALESGGPEKLNVLIARADRMIGGRNYLADFSGRNMATGGSLSDLLRKVDGHWGRPVRSGAYIIAGTKSRNQRYMFITEVSPPTVSAGFVPYFAAILALVGFPSWLFGFHVVRPLRKLAVAVDRFGRGDLRARARSSRRDEIGKLARSFDTMAARVEFLILAERQLLQDLTYELQTPLMRLGFAADLARSAKDRGPADARIGKEIDRLRDLVGSLVEIMRIESDYPSQEGSPFSLDSLLFDLVSDLRTECVEYACEISIQGCPEIELTGDPALLRYALGNVIRNAIWHAPANSTVEVMLCRIGDIARVTVRDYGRGVPPDILEGIFRPFSRVDESPLKLTGGLAARLSIVSRAIGLHSGTITAENAHPGLRMTIDMPAGPG